MVLPGDCLKGAIVDVRAAVLGVVGGQRLAPAAALGQRHLVILPGVAGEVDHDHHLLTVLADTHEAERVVVGVVAGQPLESRRVEVLAPQGGGVLVQGVEVGDQALHAAVLLPVQAIPVHRGVVVPLAVLGELVAHERQVLARVGPLVGEQRAHAGVALPVVARHLAEQGALAVDHLVMADRQHVVLRIGVDHRERDLAVVPLAVDRGFVQVLQRVMHPAHVPLQMPGLFLYAVAQASLRKSMASRFSRPP